MPSPFPGMDPYLEHSDTWPGFHKLLAAEIVGQLNPDLGPRYYADVEVRTEIEEISVTAPHVIFPDVSVMENQLPQTTALPATATLLEIAAPIVRRVAVGMENRIWAVRIFVTETSELVTAIEILSPTNKRTGEGIDEYRRKRGRILRSLVHLVELDLLRLGERPGREVQIPPLDTDYVLLVNRSAESEYRDSEIWPVALNQSLPPLPIPLLEPDPDVVLNLQSAVHNVYVRGAYSRRIDYSQPVPPPKPRPAMEAWLKEHLPAVRATA